MYSGVDTVIGDTDTSPLRSRGNDRYHRLRSSITNSLSAAMPAYSLRKVQKARMNLRGLPGPLSFSFRSRLPCNSSRFRKQIPYPEAHNGGKGNHDFVATEAAARITSTDFRCSDIRGISSRGTDPCYAREISSRARRHCLLLVLLWRKGN